MYRPTRSRCAKTGPLKERLNNWMTLVHRGQVLDAYRTFLGLMEAPAQPQGSAGGTGVRRADRYAGPAAGNRSYTTGHKAFRARSTVEIGNAIGWDDPQRISAVCRCAGYRGGTPLVFHLRDGLQPA